MSLQMSLAETSKLRKVNTSKQDDFLLLTKGKL